MDITTLLFRLGITSYMADIITPIPVNAGVAQVKFDIGKILQTNIGFIYGISTYADGVDADNNTLITTTQAQNIYMTLKDGATEFYPQARLSDYLQEFAGSPLVRVMPFVPVNIPSFDLSASFFQNPLMFTTGTIRLKLYYVMKDEWKKLEPHLVIPHSAK